MILCLGGRSIISASSNVFSAISFPLKNSTRCSFLALLDRILPRRSGSSSLPEQHGASAISEMPNLQAEVLGTALQFGDASGDFFSRIARPSHETSTSDHVVLTSLVHAQHRFKCPGHKRAEPTHTSLSYRHLWFRPRQPNRPCQVLLSLMRTKMALRQ